MTRKPAVAFVSGKSGTGKTTLLTGVLKCLKRRGYRVGTVKHSMHAIQVDPEGKDSRRHAEAGSDVTVVCGPGIMATIRRVKMPSFEEILKEASRGTDVVLVEGFKDFPVPGIEVYRSGFSRHLLYRKDKEGDTNIIAVASNASLSIDVPVLPLNEPELVCDFIEERFLKKTSNGKSDV